MKSITVTVDLDNDADEPAEMKTFSLQREVEDDVPTDAVVQELSNRLARMIRTDEPPTTIAK
jgi:hypothetical protein